MCSILNEFELKVSYKPNDKVTSAKLYFMRFYKNIKTDYSLCF